MTRMSGSARRRWALSIAVGAAVAMVVALAGPAVGAPASQHHHRTPVLGKKHLFEPYGKGWGTYRPSGVFNGGDPSGGVGHITWKHWGSPLAKGHGLTSGFKPGGGYYAKPVKIVLHASRLGRCSAGGPRAYTQLHVKVQKRPGGSHYTKWFSWAGLKSICARKYQDFSATRYATAVVAGHGRWTSHRLTITPYRLGAVKVGMRPAAASRAAGVRLTNHGDGEYSSDRAPGLVLSTGFGPTSCVVAYPPARVRTSKHIGFGSSLAALRKAYKRHLHFHTGPTGYSDPTSYYVHVGHRYLFFHLTRGRTGNVRGMAAGAGLRSAYC